MKKMLAVVLLLVVAGAIGQTGKSSQSAKQSTGGTAASQSYAGRYQMFFGPHARADVYLVDTQTGQIWKPITISNAKDTNLKVAPEIWIYQDRIDTEQQFDVWSVMHNATPPTATPKQ